MLVYCTTRSRIRIGTRRPTIPGGKQLRRLFVYDIVKHKSLSDDNLRTTELGNARACLASSGTFLIFASKKAVTRFGSFFSSGKICAKPKPRVELWFLQKAANDFRLIPTQKPSNHRPMQNVVLRMFFFFRYRNKKKWIRSARDPDYREGMTRRASSIASIWLVWARQCQRCLGTHFAPSFLQLRFGRWIRCSKWYPSSHQVGTQLSSLHLPRWATISSCFAILGAPISVYQVPNLKVPRFVCLAQLPYWIKTLIPSKYFSTIEKSWLASRCASSNWKKDFCFFASENPPLNSDVWFRLYFKKTKKATESSDRLF